MLARNLKIMAAAVILPSVSAGLAVSAPQAQADQVGAQFGTRRSNVSSQGLSAQIVVATAKASASVTYDEIDAALHQVALDLFTSGQLSQNASLASFDSARYGRYLAFIERAKQDVSSPYYVRARELATTNKVQAAIATVISASGASQSTALEAIELADATLADPQALSRVLTAALSVEIAGQYTLQKAQNAGDAAALNAINATIDSQVRAAVADAVTATAAASSGIRLATGNVSDAVRNASVPNPGVRTFIPNANGTSGSFLSPLSPPSVVVIVYRG